MAVCREVRQGATARTLDESPTTVDLVSRGEMRMRMLGTRGGERDLKA